jgi:pseudaminic acid synthase
MNFKKKKKPYFIAEISANHCGKIQLAKKLIKCAKENGADAVKLQTYTADTMTPNSNKSRFKLKSGLWKGYKLWDLYDKAHTPSVWHKSLFQYSKKLGIKIFSTPFDETAVDLLEKLNCPFYKVASFEMTDLNLIKKIAKTKKPMIISTGTSSISEIKKTFFTARKYGCKDITLLYCVSNYPSRLDDFNLNNIVEMKKKFKCKIGFSDHSKDDRVAFAAVCLGAEVIEKHIALKNQKKGFDIDFSLKGDEILRFRKNIDLASELVGKKFFFRSKIEEKSKYFRRSVYTTKTISKGEKFTKDNLKSLRPYSGLSSNYFNLLIGKISPMKIIKDEPIKKIIIKKLKIKSI